MPKVSVYLPRQLYEEVRSRGISVSAVSQRALEAELAQQTNVAWLERVRTRPVRVAENFDTSAVMSSVRDEFGT